MADIQNGDLILINFKLLTLLLNVIYLNILENNYLNMANSDVGEKITKVVKYSADKAASSAEWIKSNPKKALAVAGIAFGLVMLNGCSGGKKEVTLPDGSIVKISSKKLESGKTLQVIENKDGGVVKIPGESVGSCDGLKEQVCIKEYNEKCPDKTLDTPIDENGRSGESFCEIDIMDTKYYGSLLKIVKPENTYLRNENGVEISKNYKKIEKINGFLIAENKEGKKIILNHKEYSSAIGEIPDELSESWKEYDSIKPLGDMIIGYRIDLQGRERKEHKVADLFAQELIKWSSGYQYYAMTRIAFGPATRNHVPANIKDYKFLDFNNRKYLVAIDPKDQFRMIPFKGKNKDEYRKVIVFEKPFKKLTKYGRYVVKETEDGHKKPIDDNGEDLFFDSDGESQDIEKITNNLGEEAYILTMYYFNHEEKFLITPDNKQIRLQSVTSNKEIIGEGYIGEKDRILNANGETLEYVDGTEHSLKNPFSN